MVTITSPTGRRATVNGAGGQAGNTTTGTLRTDAYLAVNGEQGTFTESGDDTITCTVAGEFWDDPLNSQFTPPRPAISGVEDSSTSSNTIYAGTSGYLSIYGTSLIAAGETQSPSVNSDSGNIELSLSYASDNQVNASYTISSGVTLGTHTLTITTEAGTSNSGSFVIAAPSCTN